MSKYVSLSFPKTEDRGQGKGVHYMEGKTLVMEKRSYVERTPSSIKTVALDIPTKCEINKGIRVYFVMDLSRTYVTHEVVPWVPKQY